MNNEIVQQILNNLDIATLMRIKTQCEMYITYTIDNKQINKKNEIKTKQKEFAILLEMVESTLVYKRFENKVDTAAQGENIKSCINSNNKQDNKKTKNKKNKEDSAC